MAPLTDSICAVSWFALTRGMFPGLSDACATTHTGTAGLPCSRPFGCPDPYRSTGDGECAEGPKVGCAALMLRAYFTNFGYWLDGGRYFGTLRDAVNRIREVGFSATIYEGDDHPFGAWCPIGGYRPIY